MAQCSLDLPYSANVFFTLFVETGFCQMFPSLVSNSWACDLSASASQSAWITGVAMVPSPGSRVLITVFYSARNQLSCLWVSAIQFLNLLFIYPQSVKYTQHINMWTHRPVPLQGRGRNRPARAQLLRLHSPTANPPCPEQSSTVQRIEEQVY